MKNSIYLLVSVFALSFSAQSQDFDYSFVETYKLDSQANLTVSSYDSDIEVIAHDSKEIEVFYVVHKRNQLIKSTKKEIESLVANQWKFDIEETENTLVIRVLSTVKKGHINSKDAIDIHFKIYVPKETSTDLYSSDGDILLQGLTSNQKCISSDGDIKLDGLTGKVYAQTSDGDVFLKNVTGDVETITHDGKVINLEDRKI
ncbi:hypothetical protein [Maribacter sp. 4G9]|uniref:hypothetical protein n=1 Tax=Maribacter sp. 4G9 TaxID=1889777 RepID=UPI000C151DC5|nr:hypothetical protein [Maribacter sp. 4G9]PIB31431.1 hypothetical protein BFP75_01405 [Maribacter sp. 4G9]